MPAGIVEGKVKVRTVSLSEDWPITVEAPIKTSLVGGILVPVIVTVPPTLTGLVMVEIVGAEETV